MRLARGEANVGAAEGDAASLLRAAWALEPRLELERRRHALDTLEALLSSDHPPAPLGRNWELELLAERAVDASIHARSDEAIAIADEVLASVEVLQAPIAEARAHWARGRALAWRGTDSAVRDGDRELTIAAARYEALGDTEWQGYTKVWHGHTVHYENGRPRAARSLIEAGLALLWPDSPWRATALVFLADTLVEVGELPAAERAIDAAFAIAADQGDLKSRDYATWTAAAIAAVREDPHLTERLLAEVERDHGDWFTSHLGVYFLADAAVLLDRVGLRGPARRSLGLARARGGIGDDYVIQAEAAIAGRSGDPGVAEELLQEVVRNDWVEKRLRWRSTLLLAWTRLRAGDRTDAGRVAARALEQAQASGGLIVAETAEPLLVRALAPLALEAGSPLARSLVCAGGRPAVRLFGDPAVTAADGTMVALPPGMPGAIVRMLAVNEHGLPIDGVLDALFGEVDATRGRQRLRQLLLRLRAAGPELVVRDGERLRLAPAWVDAREFDALARAARATRGERAPLFAHAALGLAGRGPLLPSDPYASWAEPARAEVADAIAELEAILVAG